MSNIGFAGVTNFAMTSTATAVRVMGVTGVGGSSEEVQGPSLGLNFLTGPTGQPVLDPRITFSRASNATVTGPDGTLQYAPHNLLTFSEQFDNAVWNTGGSGTIDANVDTAPDGTSTADRLTTTGGTGSRFQSVNVSAGLTYTFSVYVKLGTMSVASYRLAIYNNTAAGWIAQDIVPDQTPTSTEWTRVTYTFVVPAGCSSIRVYPFRNGNSITSSTVLFWGAQLNVGALQPYYPTTVKNLLGFTQEFDNAAWTKTDWAVTANATTAPDGSLTADRITRATTTNTFNAISQASVTVVSGTKNTFSCYVKADQYTKFGLREGATSGFYASFNLATGTVIETSGTGLTASITPVGNGWYRCEIDLPITGTSFGVRINPLPDSYTSGSTSFSWAGNTTDGIFIWGAQLSDSASLDQYVYNPGAAPAAAAYYGPRFDYDPVTLAPKGLLIEEQRTNLLLQSGFAGAVAGTPGTAPTSWSLSPSGGAIDSVVTDLLGQNTVTLSATANRQALNQTITLVANTTYTLSTVVVANSGVAVNQLLAAVNPPAGATQSYTINGVTVVNPNVTAPIAGDRVAIVLVVAATAGTVIVRLGVGVNGNVTGTVALKWPQVEAGAFATSYIPTTTAAATRAADVAVMTGANFSNWFGSPNENTFYVEASKSQTNNANAILLEGADIRGLTISTDGTGSKARVLIRQGAARMDSGSFAPVFAADSVLKIAAGTSASGSAAVFNGTVVSTGTPSQNDWGNELRIGNRMLLPITVTNYWNGHIRRIAYFPHRLSNAELQAITS